MQLEYQQIPKYFWMGSKLIVPICETFLFYGGE